MFKEYGKNNLLHIKLSSLLKSILSFLLKESEGFQGSASASQNDNLLPQMSNFSPPNNEVSSKMDSMKRCSQILRDTLEYLNKGIVMFLKGLSARERNNFLFKGFILQICRIIIPFEKRGHQVVKDSADWKQMYYNFLFHELKKEDRILVEDPRQTHKISEDNIRLPSNFKFNNSSLQEKMNLKSNYDSLGNQGMIEDIEDEEEEEVPKESLLKELDAHHKDSDSSDSDSDEDLLKNYSFGKPGELLLPKKLDQDDNDFRGYDSGTGKGVDFAKDPVEDATFTKSNNKDIYSIVNDWNIYAQGSWKGLGDDLQDETPLKQYSSVNKEGLVSNSLDSESENLQRHKISRKDNKKYGLYGSLTRRFQIQKKERRETKEVKDSESDLKSFYNSGNQSNQSKIKR